MSAGQRLVVLALLCTATGIAFAAEPKKLIEFGWDEPGTAFLRAHLAEMERSPFDGCVFHVDVPKAGGGTSRFTWECWGAQQFTETDLQPAFDDLRAIRPTRLKHNFLRFNTTPAKLDWFDNHGAVIANARLAGELARAGNCPGILFDIEQYEGQLFDYRKQRDAVSKPWEVYATQVRQRGREVMHAFQQGHPEVVVFLTFGYSLPWQQSQGGKVPLADCNYGLLSPFLDGMLEAAQNGARIVDGHELSYGFKDPAQFTAARRMMRSDLLPLVGGDKEKYGRVFSAAFGIWMDHDWRKFGWNVEEPAKNYFSPEAFERSVRAALGAADEYVWIYTETPRWWSPEGGPIKLPPAYDAALRAARASAGDAADGEAKVP